MIRKLLTHILRLFALVIIGGLLLPFFDGGDVLDAYREPLYWLITAALASFIYSVNLYFTECNRRHFYRILSPVSTALGLVIILLAVLAIFPISFLSLFSSFLTALFLSLDAVLIFFSWYLFFHRGVCFYENGKIRIFKFKIYTYKNGTKIESIDYEKRDKKTYMILKMAGDTHAFRIDNKPSGKLSELEITVNGKGKRNA